MAMNWATLLAQSRPRPSTSSGDHRAQFERDFDRCVFSTPVKRLQDKAQVFPLEPHDAVRTRLTHSLEVSSVARGLGIAIGKWLLEKNEIKAGMDRSIEAICATCGLIHDLGNPPFGHSGEDAIRHWFGETFGEAELEKILTDDQYVQDFLTFEGNAQSLRLVGKLQILADFHGLNLTFGTLSAACKYTAASNEAGSTTDHAKSKTGYFASENDLIQDIRKNTGTGDSRNPIAFLVEAADDIVYSVADVEDAVKKGVLTWPWIANWLQQYNDATIGNALKGMLHILKAGQPAVPEGLKDDVYASAFRTASIGIVVEAVVDAFKVRYDTIMKGAYTGELVADCKASALVSKLKELGRTKVYCTSSNLKLELMGRRIIVDLMDLFWEGAQALPKSGDPKTRTFGGKLGALFSDNYRRVFQHSIAAMPSFPEQYHRFQLVTDYVCGMTDTFARRLHAELMNG